MLVTEHKCPCFSPRNRLHWGLRSKFLHFTSKEAVAPVTEKAPGRGLSVKHRLIICAYKGPQFYIFHPSLKQIQAMASSEPLQIKLSVCAGKQSWSCRHHQNHPSLRIHSVKPGKPKSSPESGGVRMDKDKGCMPLSASLPLQVKVRYFKNFNHSEASPVAQW